MSGADRGGVGGGSFRDYVSELTAIANRRSYQVLWMDSIVTQFDGLARVYRKVIAECGLKGKFADALKAALDQSARQHDRNAEAVASIRAALDYADGHWSRRSGGGSACRLRS